MFVCAHQILTSLFSILRKHLATTILLLKSIVTMKLTLLNKALFLDLVTAFPLGGLGNLGILEGLFAS